MANEEQVQVIREYADANWLNLEYKGNRTIRVDARAVDRIMADGSRLVFHVCDYTVALHVQSAEVAHVLVKQLQPYTRSAPIGDQATYELTKQRIAALKARVKPPIEPILFLGEIEIVARDDRLWIGDDHCSFDTLHEGANKGHAIRLSNGSVIQAQMAMLAFAHQLHTEDVDWLSKRVAAYELRGSSHSDA